MNQTLKIGVAGLGRAFSQMLPTFLQDPRVKLVAATDPIAFARAQFEKDFELFGVSWLHQIKQL